MKTFIQFVFLFTAFFMARNCIASPCSIAEQNLTYFAIRNSVTSEKLIKMLTKNREFFGQELEQSYCSLIIEDITKKESSNISYSESDLMLHLIEYEKFRLDRYISSAVSPKRYFGFFDEKGDTAIYEHLLKETITQAVPVINKFSESKGLQVHVSDKEIAVTFLSEGGALLMTTRTKMINRVHPIRDVGLDDFRLGFPHYPELIKILDSKFKTDIAGLSWNFFGNSVLIRPMTFKEAILGTAVMYLYEKELATTFFYKSNHRALDLEPLNRQFIHASFVYNSGLFFSEERINQITNFSTAEYLYNSNIKNSHSRPLLPIFAPQEIRDRLKSNQKIPRQNTSWNTVYHILQRYGAWVALEKFSDYFNEQGMFNQIKRE